MPSEYGPYVDWPATTRYRLSGAPGELGLVQDLLNTIEEGSAAPPDLLGSLESAQEWADIVVERWRSIDDSGWIRTLPPLTEADRMSLIEFRTRLFDGLFGHPGAEERGAGEAGEARASLLTISHGRIEITPAGDGWRYFETALLLICYRAQQIGALRRLKTCKSEECDVVFYDRSANNSAVWHDVRVCGNRANVRAFRARTRER
jgi:hypothetical protein